MPKPPLGSSAWPAGALPWTWTWACCLLPTQGWSLCPLLPAPHQPCFPSASLSAGPCLRVLWSGLHPFSFPPCLLKLVFSLLCLYGRFLPVLASWRLWTWRWSMEWGKHRAGTPAPGLRVAGWSRNQGWRQPIVRMAGVGAIWAPGGLSSGSSTSFRTECGHDGCAVPSDLRVPCARPMEVVFLARLNSEVKS